MSCYIFLETLYQSLAMNNFVKILREKKVYVICLYIYIILF